VLRKPIRIERVLPLLLQRVLPFDYASSVHLG
jgi:hypothetical protein